MKSNWLNQALRQWQNEGIALNPPTTLTTISDAEQKLIFTFPDSFKELYLAADGFKDNAWRENMFSIWPIERILFEFIERKDSLFIGFSDYLINSHALGFYRGFDGIYKDVDPHFPVARSFEECINFINSDTSMIY